MARALPSGRVTFAFTDVVGSTSLFADHADAYPDALLALRERVEHTTRAQDGVVVEHEGDGALLAFPTAVGAVRALSALARGLVDEPLPLGLQVRMGAHTGDAVPVGTGYISLDVSVTARVTAAANAGQLLVTEPVAAEWARDPSGGPALDHGLYALKGVPSAVRLLELVGEGEAPRASAARRTNVARPRTSFHGRAAELRRLQELTSRPGVVTVTGPGGAGKTRTVSEWALTRASDSEQGVWLAELATLPPGADAAGVWRAVADAGGSEGPHAVLVTRWAAARPGLVVVLDNCEHLVDAVIEVVESLQDAAPDLTLVTTSREPLGIAGERVISLRPLGREEPAAAQSLFVERARQAGAEIGTGDLALVDAVCRGLDGLPLAIELAAPRILAMPLAAFLDRITHDPSVLQRRGGADRQRSLEALVEWSLRLLDERHRRAFLVLTVLSGRFDDVTAASLLVGAGDAAARHDASSVLAHLTERHLLDLDGPDHRMLVTLRTVGTRLRRGQPDLDHAAFEGLHAWADARGRDLDAGGPPLTLDELHDATEAARWALGAGRLSDQTLSAVASALPHFGADPAMVGLALGVLALQPASDVDGIRLETRAWTVLRRSVPQDWDRRTADLVARAEATGDDATRAGARWVAGLMASLSGEPARALPYMTSAGDLYELVGNHHRAAVVRGNVAALQFNLGDLHAARDGYLATMQRLDPTDPNYAVMGANLAEVQIDLGEHAAAEAQLRRVITADATPHPIRAYSSALLAEAMAGQGRTALAEVTAQEARRSIAALAESHPDIAEVLVRMDAALTPSLTE